jgi:hypothetical protein
MSTPIEGFRAEEDASGAKIDRRSREYRNTLRSQEESGRPDMRPDSIREAELRAQEIFDETDGSEGLGTELNLPANLAPEGWEYQLRANTVLGKENRHHMLNLLRNGWRAVPASRHPWLMPAGHEGPIEIGGQILMEIPTLVADKRRKLEKGEAMDQLRNSEAMLHEAPPNTGPRDDPKLANKVTREYERGAPSPRRDQD